MIQQVARTAEETRKQARIAVFCPERRAGVPVRREAAHGQRCGRMPAGHRSARLKIHQTRPGRSVNATRFSVTQPPDVIDNGYHQRQY
ncbi:hypothetical protein [Frankia sp. Cj3]|uniref:hypothetical protein n=1 Tax=Frankia sp. Cj3 TaxID=2880976 RepID=UPI001EF49665|nr:hypothetical protein [Frankia sp. Cj3]